MALCGIQRMQSGVCVELAKCHSPAVPLPHQIVFFNAVVDRIVKIGWMRIFFFGIARMVKRQVHLVLAPLRALRSHRRVFARVIQDYTEQCGVSLIAFGMT